MLDLYDHNGEDRLPDEDGDYEAWMRDRRSNHMTIIITLGIFAAIVGAAYWAAVGGLP